MKLLAEYWHIIAAVLGLSGSGGLIGFLAGKKEQKSKAKKTEADALTSTQSVYDMLTKHMEEALKEMRLEISDLKKENIEQRKEMRVLHSDNRKLHLEVSNMHKENNELKDMIRKLEDENKKLYADLQRYKNK
jgi:predicted RNase H-like nuclease (RuvC/YqgF family)